MPRFTLKKLLGAVACFAGACAVLMIGDNGWRLAASVVCASVPAGGGVGVVIGRPIPLAAIGLACSALVLVGLWLVLAPTIPLVLPFCLAAD